MSDEMPDADNDETAEPTQKELEALLEQLRMEHRRVDDEIAALTENGVADMLKVQRMKKIKLSMKDQIVYLETQLRPVIIA